MRSLDTQCRRALAALRRRPHTREELDRACDASNSPDVVFELRSRGYVIVCQIHRRRRPDGTFVRFGRYSFISSPAHAEQIDLNFQGEHRAAPI